MIHHGYSKGVCVCVCGELNLNFWWANPKADKRRCVKAEQGLETLQGGGGENMYEKDLSPLFLGILLASSTRSISLSIRRLYEV